MASAFKSNDGYGWIADFRPFMSPGRRRRRVRIPGKWLKAGPDEKKAALAYADECDRYCRVLEVQFDTRKINDNDVHHALQLKAITQDQADIMLFNPDQIYIPEADPGGLKIIDAAEAHPSTKYEAEHNSADYYRHMRELKEFCEWADIEYVEDLHLEHVQRWVAELKKREYTWYSRRHRLFYLRHACKYAETQRIPNVLALLRDRNDSHKIIEVWTLEELCNAASKLQDQHEDRTLAVLALGGFMGLRPSEICRIQVGDIEQDVLKIGLRKYKNDTSRRNLPIPSIVFEWLTPFLEDRGETDPLITFDKSHNKPLNIGNLSRRFAPVISELTGKKMPIKYLRKSFLTWAIRRGMNVHHIEAYAGHRESQIIPITERSYLAEVQTIELRPIAKEIDKSIRSFYGRFLRFENPLADRER